jgi:hypothetical protein
MSRNCVSNISMGFASGVVKEDKKYGQTIDSTP